ncbi:MAG: dihydrodipicolinate synthase family protein [Eubacteriales bacterium]|nr:dihydrodipicolinate synthase family protein [Eubacteriales bacterium]
MKDITKYQGIIPAFYACYDKNGEISLSAVRELTDYMIEKKVKGVYVGGSSGECIYLSVPERKQILETVIDQAKGKLTVIAHVGCNSTRDSAELAKHAESVGADAIASIPPIYFKLPEYAIAKYWNDMSAAAPNTDFVIYNIPQLAGVALTMPLFREMIKNPNVIAVKNSSMPVQDIQMFKDEGTRGGRDFVVFNGPDEQLISGLVMGADGGIGGTYGVMPELYVKMFDLVKAGGDLELAKKIQYDADNIIYAMCSTKGNMYATIKAILKKRCGLELGGVRAPLYDLIPEDMPIVDKCAAMIDEAIAKYC